MLRLITLNSTRNWIRAVVFWPFPYLLLILACIPPIVLEEVWDAGWQELSITGRSWAKIFFSLCKLGTAKSCAQLKLSACLFIAYPKAFKHVQSIYPCSRKKECNVWGLLLSASFILGVLITPHGYLAIAEL